MSIFEGFSTPIFVICRDKVSQLTQLLEWLETSGYSNIILVDNNSTYDPLLEFLEKTEHSVVRHPENMGPHRAIWRSGLIPQHAASKYYAVTDSDVIPEPDCPADALHFFHYALERYPDYLKAGFSLRIDNLPEHYAMADEVRLWERPFWMRRLEKGMYHAVIDTTFALYRPDSEFEYSPSIRTDRPYWARHDPWYSSSDDPTLEEQYYREHAVDGVAHWDLDGQVKWARPPGMTKRERLSWPLHSAFKVRRNRTVTWVPQIQRWE